MWAETRAKRPHAPWLDVEQELSQQGHDLISERLCSTRLVPPAMPPNPSDAGEQWRTQGPLLQVSLAEDRLLNLAKVKVSRVQCLRYLLVSDSLVCL